MDKYICRYDEKINKLLEINLPICDIIYADDGLKKHLLKQNHNNCVQYIANLENILKTANFVGKSNGANNSFEMVKCMGDNVLIALKFDVKKENIYVASIYEISQSKLKNRLNCGRLVEYR